MSKYAELDRLILAAMRNGAYDAYEIADNRAARTEAEKLALMTAHRGAIFVIYSRLQPLRRAGKIEYVRSIKRWRLA